MSNDEDDMQERVYGAFTLFDDGIAIVISASVKDLEARVDQSRAHIWWQGSWSSLDLPQSCVAVRMWERDLIYSLYLSHDGILLRDDSETDIVGEALDPSRDTGPNNLVMMRNMKIKGDVLVAVGMARLAYEKKLPDGPWRKIDQGIYVPRAQRTTAVGLNDVAFDRYGGLVAVGYKGEIWRRDSAGAWHALPSPTNVYLSAIAAHPAADELTIVGLNGVVLQGNSHSGWSVVPDAPPVNFWGVTYFGDAIYLSSNDGLYRLRAGSFDVVNFGTGSQVSTSAVESAKGSIWSVGEHDIFQSTDGVTWTALPPPA